MPNATILQPFGFEIYWQMLFYFVAKGKTADNGDKCNRKLCNKTLANIKQTRFEHFQETKLSKKGKMQVENRPQWEQVQQKTFATNRLQISYGHVFNICRNKTSVIKGKKQNKKSPLQKNKGVSPDKIDTSHQVLFLPPFKAAERKVIIK